METVARPKRKWRRAMVATSVLSGMLFTAGAIAPMAVMNSTYRDSILNSRLEARGLKATSAAGSGSWITPFEFRDIRITDETGQIQCSIDAIRTSKSLIGLIFHGGDLGTFTVIKPQLSVQVDDDGKLPLKPAEESEPKTGQPNLAFVVEDAAFKLVAPWRPLPVVDLQNLDISGAVATTDAGRWLTLDPVQVFDHEKLAEPHTEQNLALIAPILAQTTALAGDVSVRLNETRIRLDGDEKLPIRLDGEAVFHSVEAKLKQEWAAQVSQMIGQATGTAPSSRLQIARDSAVQFEVTERGVYHEGLAFLLPDLASRMQIESSGLVGLDETLDLTFAMQLPQSLSGGAFLSLVSKMVSAPLKLFVKGTVSEPKLVMPQGFSVVDQLSRNLAPEKHTDQPPPVTDAVMDLIGAAASPPVPGQGESITGSVLNMIRAAKEAKANAPPKEPRVKKRRKRSL